MTCSQAERYFLAHSRGEQTPEGLRSHLATCPHCQSALEGFTRAGELLRALPAAPVREDFRAALASRLAMDPTGLRPARGRPFLAIGLAAAAVVAVVAIGARLMVPQTPPASPLASHAGPQETAVALTAPDEPTPAAPTAEAAASTPPTLPAPDTGAVTEAEAPGSVHPLPARPGLAGTLARREDSSRDGMGAIEDTGPHDLATMTAPAPAFMESAAAERAVEPALEDRGAAPGAPVPTEPPSTAAGGMMGGAGGGIGDGGGGFGGLAGGPGAAMGATLSVGDTGDGGPAQPAGIGSEAGRTHKSGGLGAPVGPAGMAGPRGPAGAKGEAEAAGAASAEASAGREPAEESERYSFEFADVEVGVAIRRIEEVTGARVHVRSPLDGRPRVTRSLKEVTARDALAQVCGPSGLRLLSLSDGSYVIRAPRAPQR